MTRALSRAAIAALGVTLMAPPAAAAGLDLPVLYSARHAGMGGAAIAGVDEPSAIALNPAGLAATDRLRLTANLSLIVADLQTAAEFEGQEATTGPTPGGLPLGGVAWRVHERLTVGLAFFAAGGGGGRFEYANEAGVETLNEQLGLLFEISPALAVDLPGRLRLGFGWRISVLRFKRLWGPTDDPGKVDADLAGVDLAGFRVGLQWQASDHWDVGLVYRHKVTVEGKADSGRLLFEDLRDVRATLTLPTKLGLGVRARYGPITVASDVELVLNSQFATLDIRGDVVDQGTKLNVPFFLKWADSVTAKVGAEAAITDRLRGRIGYAYDGRAANRHYPNAFSPPPTSAHVLTFGAGWDAGRWQLNLAIVHQLEAASTIPQEDVVSDDDCPQCSEGGRYALKYTMAAVDFSWELGRE